MIFETAYDTSVGVGYNEKDIQNSLIEAYYNQDCKAIYEDVYGVIQNTKAKSFPHPVYLRENNKSLGMFIDLRGMNKANIDEDFVIKVRDKSEYDLLTTRARLNKIWIEQAKDVIKFIHPKLILIYAEWLSSNIGKRFALDYKDITTIKTLCGLYYLSLFDKPTDWDKHYTANALLQITQVMKIPSVFAKEVILDIEKPLTNIQSLIDIIKEKTDNVRLDSLTPGVLLTIISSTWFGNNHAEILAIAIEHPPTFVSLVNASINDNLYRRVGFSQVVQNVLKSESKNVSMRIADLLS